MIYVSKRLLKLGIAGALLCGTSTLFSQTGEQEVPKDPKAKAILDAVSKKNKSYTTIQSDFDYNLKNEDSGIDQSVSGTILIKGDKYKGMLGEQEQRSDGKHVWTYMKDIDEVQVSCPNDAEVTPASVFTIWEDGFKYKYDKQITSGGVKVEVIKMYPIVPGKKNYHTVKLYVDNAKKEIKKVEIFMKDGNLFTITIKKFTPNVSAPDGIFKFDTSKVDEVIDLTDGGC